MFEIDEFTMNELIRNHSGENPNTEQEQSSKDHHKNNERKIETKVLTDEQQTRVSRGIGGGQCARKGRKVEKKDATFEPMVGFLRILSPRF